MILILVIISLGVIGGCNNHNGGGFTQTSVCAPFLFPCISITSNADGTIVECRLDPALCRADLTDVKNQVINKGFSTVTEDTPRLRHGELMAVVVLPSNRLRGLMHS